MSDRVFDTRPGRKKLPPREVPAPEPAPIEQITDDEMFEDLAEQLDTPAEEVNETPAQHKKPVHHTKAKAHRHGG